MFVFVSNEPESIEGRVGTVRNGQIEYLAANIFKTTLAVDTRNSLRTLKITDEFGSLGVIV